MQAYKSIFILTSILLTFACAVEESGTSLEIIGAVEPDTTSCKAGSIMFESGLYDPMGLVSERTPDGFLVGFSIENKLRQGDADQIDTSHGWTSVRPSANNLQILGFDTCFYRADDISVAAFNSHHSGQPIDCSTLPKDQQAFLTTSLWLLPGASGNTTIKILTPSQLQADGLFGANFKAEGIPLQGSTSIDTNFDTDTSDPTDEVYSFGPESFAPETRNEAWGTFPASQKSTIIAQVRANGKTQTGEVVQSNWYVLPIEICLGCAATTCGDLQKTVCSGDYCSDGSGCPSSGVCANDGVNCTPMVTAFTGAIASAVNACAPAQQNTSLTCEEITFCP